MLILKGLKRYAMLHALPMVVGYAMILLGDFICWVVS